MPSRKVSIGIDESLCYGVVVAAVEIVQASFVIIVIPTITEGILYTDSGCKRACCGNKLPPRIVSVLSDYITTCIGYGNNISLYILYIEVWCSIEFKAC